MFIKAYFECDPFDFIPGSLACHTFVHILREICRTERTYCAVTCISHEPGPLACCALWQAVFPKFVLASFTTKQYYDCNWNNPEFTAACFPYLPAQLGINTRQIESTFAVTIHLRDDHIGGNTIDVSIHIQHDPRKETSLVYHRNS